MGTALITGASDGIGRALAQIYLAQGARVIALGRRPAEALDAPLRDDYCRVDLAQPGAPAQVAAHLRARGVGRLDLLIHCAGVGSYGPIAGQPPEQIDAILGLNLRAPIELTHALLPLLAGGRVVLIGSVAAALPAPRYAAYAASKAALEGFARSLRIELRGRTAVQVVHPGPARTAMHARAGAPLDAIGWRRFPPPEREAAQIARAIARGRAVATTGPAQALLRAAGRRLAALVDWLAERRGGG